MLVIDDLFTKEETEKIKKTLLSKNFPWFHAEKTVDEEGDNKPQKDSKTYEYLFFYHVFIYENVEGHTKIESERYLPIVGMIVDKVQQRFGKQILIRWAKANFQTKVSTDLVYNTPHIDIKQEKDFLTMLYYVNDSDGKTFIFEDREKCDEQTEDWKIEHTIPSKEGRILIFDGKKFHSGSHPKEGNRLVINFVLEF